jgi:isopropylmalate/homocitrate/citramalate synthase
MDLENLGFRTLPLETDPVIDDTTLRDGVQMPGLAVSPEGAAEIARLLDAIGVERIELHHYQKSDKKAARMIRDMSLSASIAGWCRAVKDDIDDALSCGFEDIGVSHPVSHIHFKAKWPDKTSTLPRIMVLESLSTVKTAPERTGTSRRGSSTLSPKPALNVTASVTQ